MQSHTEFSCASPNAHSTSLHQFPMTSYTVMLPGQSSSTLQLHRNWLNDLSLCSRELGQANQAAPGTESLSSGWPPPGHNPAHLSGHIYGGQSTYKTHCTSLLKDQGENIWWHRLPLCQADVLFCNKLVQLFLWAIISLKKTDLRFNDAAFHWSPAEAQMDVYAVGTHIS